MSETRTEEQRAQHRDCPQTHLKGIVWDCPYCKALWAKTPTPSKELLSALECEASITPESDSARLLLAARDTIERQRAENEALRTELDNTVDHAIAKRKRSASP